MQPRRSFPVVLAPLSLLIFSCADPDTKTETVAMSDGITTCTVYNVCTAGNYPVEWCPVPGGVHTVPAFTGPELGKFFLQF